MSLKWSHMISAPSQKQSGKYLLPIREVVALMSLAIQSQPNEVSGLLLAHDVRNSTVLSFVPTSMTSNTNDSFRISRNEIRHLETVLAESPLRVCGCAHSHVRTAAYPSRRDAHSVKESVNLWLIVSVAHQQLRLFEWDGIRFERKRLYIDRSLTRETEIAKWLGVIRAAKTSSR
jgi:proteasome lid subunit RPN8/RPN11